MNLQRINELRTWTDAHGLLRSETVELLDAVEAKNKEIYDLKLKQYRFAYWLERSREPFIEFVTNAVGIFSIFLKLKNKDISIHFFPKKGWRLWGCENEWYDSGRPSFGLGPFLTVVCERLQYGTIDTSGEFTNEQ